jgi:putative selenate reductase molybdopterin-binding subunit
MAFPIESAMDELARKLNITPIAIRRKNMIRPGDALHSIWDSPDDVEIGSYGLDQCLDFVEDALASGRGLAKPEGDEWLTGSGLALHVQECAPPTEHRSEAHLSLKEDGTYHLAIGTSEFGNGTITSNRQVAASILNSAAGTIGVINADTDSTPYDTGTFASVGTSIGALAVKYAADALRNNLLELASRQTSTPIEECFLSDRTVICGGRVLPLSELYAATAEPRHQLKVARKSYATPRTTAFNVQGFRIAVHRVTGEIKILQSVHAADAGTILNPMQCRGQVEGSIAQGIGVTLFERMIFNEAGAVVNPNLRNYRIPAFADIPRSEIFFAKTHDKFGALGAKPMGEAPIIPISPALANALADATGIRFDTLPFSPDLIFKQLAEMKPTN